MDDLIGEAGVNPPKQVLFQVEVIEGWNSRGGVGGPETGEKQMDTMAGAGDRRFHLGTKVDLAVCLRRLQR